MRNLSILITMALPSLATAQQPTVPVQPPPPRCDATRTVVLQPGEFSLDAYDAQDSLLLIKPVDALLPTTAKRPSPVRLRPTSGASGYRLPLTPDAFQEAVDAHRTGQLFVSLSVSSPDAQGPDCEVDVDPLHSRLVVHDQSSGQVLERKLPPARVVTRRPTGKVRVGRIQVDVGEMGSGRDKLEGALVRVGQDCMEQALRDRPVVNGSLHVQLERSATGALRPPQVVVDGLACPFVAECLTHGLEGKGTAEVLNETLPEGVRVFVPFFFKGAMEEQVVEP